MRGGQTRPVILLADDDEEDRILACDAIAESRLSNEVYCVTDGEDLMDYLRKKGQYRPPATAPRPGLILLDLHMPKKDGSEALREIKADPALRAIPVVVLTTSRTDEDIFHSYDAGANSFISKPVIFDSLINLMKSLGEYWFETVALPFQETPKYDPRDEERGHDQ